MLKRVKALKLPERETLEPGVIMEGFNEEVKLIFLFDCWVEIEYDKKMFLMKAEVEMDCML